MGTNCSLAIDSGSKKAAQISDAHSAIVIIINAAVCLTTIEFFIIEIWPLHGLASLLLFVIPLCLSFIVANYLPNSYFEIKSFESSGRVYEFLGIKLFRRLVPRGTYINKLIRRYQPTYRVVRRKESIVELEATTRYAERCHVVSVLFVLPAVVYALMLGWSGFAMVLALPNIPAHVYPIILQRYTRARINKVFNR